MMCIAIDDQCVASSLMASAYSNLFRTGRGTSSFQESYAKGNSAFQKTLGGDDENRSFSIILWQNGVVLDLVAQSAHHCRAWVTGLNVSYPFTHWAICNNFMCLDL